MLIDGKAVALKEKEMIKQEIIEIVESGKRAPKLVVIIVGDDPASHIYVNSKEKTCKELGMDSEVYRLESTCQEKIVLNTIEKLNKDDTVDGILVQLPLPKHIDEKKVITSISPLKDVDGFHPENVAKLCLNQDGFRPCTPEGIMVLLESIDCQLEGKQVVVIGRSDIVGKPVSLLCLHKNATVTIAHSKTKDLKATTKQADVLIVAVGIANFIDDSYVKEGVVVIDVGINRLENKKICGDVNFNKVKDKASYITPVPGGVGPLTIAMLLKNTLKAYKNRLGE